MKEGLYLFQIMQKYICYQDKTFPVKQNEIVAVTTHLHFKKNISYLLKISLFFNTLELLF